MDRAQVVLRCNQLGSSLADNTLALQTNLACVPTDLLRHSLQTRCLIRHVEVQYTCLYAAKTQSWFTTNTGLLCVRTPFVIEESCKEVHTAFLIPQSITVALLARLTDTLPSNNYSDRILANKESIADYHLG
jgi:hypothetical protein